MTVESLALRVNFLVNDTRKLEIDYMYIFSRLLLYDESVK